MPALAASQYMMISALSFSLMSLFVKLSANAGIPVIEILASRTLISLVLSYWFAKRAGLYIWGTHRRLLIARGLVGFCALLLVYYCISELPLAEATILQFLSPIFTALLGWLILREQVSKSLAASITLSLLGAVVITKPGLFHASLNLASNALLPPMAIAAGIGGAMLSGLAYVLVRKLSDLEHPLVIVFYFPMIALPLTIPFTIAQFVMPDLLTLGYLVLVGGLTQLGQLSLTQAMQTENASKNMAFAYLQVVFAALWGVLILNEQLLASTIAGGALVLIGAFINYRSSRKS